jgi:hypothetical protein
MSLLIKDKKIYIIGRISLKFFNLELKLIEICDFKIKINY